MLKTAFIVMLLTLSSPVLGLVLHVGDNYVIKLSKQRQTTPSLVIEMPDNSLYYAPLGRNCGRVNLEYNNSVLEVCDGMARLEYLESDGHQCIDTGIVPTGTTSFELKIYVAADKATSTGQVPLGARKNINGREWYYQISTFNIFPNGYIGYGEERIANANLKFRDINIISFSSGQYSINQSYSYTYDTIDLPSEFQNSLYMFCLNSQGSGTLAPDYFTGKIYYVKIWDGDNLLRDYIPVLDENGTPAMYDRVSGQLFYNHGTGDFQYALK